MSNLNAKHTHKTKKTECETEIDKQNFAILNKTKQKIKNSNNRI